MKILEQNDRLSLISQYTIVDKLENRYYKLDWDDLGNVFLIKISSPGIPTKIYDYNEKNRKLIINSFHNSEKNTGIVLTGDKGTGKSIDAKLLCKEINMPIITIDREVPKSIDFVKFLESIEQSYVLFVDEFEKLFKNYSTYVEIEEKMHTQLSFMSMMDGTSNKFKKLFLFTTNEDVDVHLLNRPSRVKYLIKYKGIKEDLAILIINDLLINKEFSTDLIDNTNLNNLSIDVLISIIQEVNLHGIKYSEFKNLFNYQEETNTYEVFLKQKSTGSFEPILDLDVDFDRVPTNTSLYYRGNSYMKTSSSKDEYLYTYKDSVIKLIRTSNKIKYVF